MQDSAVPEASSLKNVARLLERPDLQCIGLALGVTQRFGPWCGKDRALHSENISERAARIKDGSTRSAVQTERKSLVPTPPKVLAKCEWYYLPLFSTEYAAL